MAPTARDEPAAPFHGWDSTFESVTRPSPRLPQLERDDAETVRFPRLAVGAMKEVVWMFAEGD
jgi:hypothetical protein